MTDMEIKNILGPHPAIMAMNSFRLPAILIALIALLFFIGGDAAPIAFFLIIALGLVIPISLGLSIGLLSHLSTYKFLYKRLSDDKITPGYTLNPQKSNGYIIIDKSRNIIVLGKQDRDLRELNKLEYYTDNKRNDIEFIFSSGDDPIVKYKIHSNKDIKNEFIKISNHLELTAA